MTGPDCAMSARGLMVNAMLIDPAKTLPVIVDLSQPVAHRRLSTMLKE
jgi:hypothetical protein